MKTLKTPKMNARQAVTGMNEIPPADYDERDRELLDYLATYWHEHGEYLWLDMADDMPGWTEDEEGTEERLRRFVRLGLMSEGDDESERVITHGLLRLHHQLRNPPKPDYRRAAGEWFWARPWSVFALVAAVGFPLAVQWVEGMRQILRWFGIGN